MAARRPPTALMTLTVTFQLGTDPDKAQQLVQNRVAQAEPRLPEEVRRLGVTTVKSSPDLTMVVHLLSPNEPLRHDLPAQLRGAERQGPAGAHRRRRPGAAVRRAATTRCASGSTRRRSRERGLSASDVVRAIRAQNVQAAAGVVGASPGLPGVDLQLSINAQGRLQSEEEFGDIIVKTGADGAVTRLRDVARIELGAADYALRSLLDNKPAVGDRRVPGAGLERARRSRTHVRADDGRAQEEHARGRRLRDRLRPDAVRARLDRGGGAHAARGDRARGARRDPVPADLARLDHPAAGGAGLDRRHVRGDAPASASRSTR